MGAKLHKEVQPFREQTVRWLEELEPEESEQLNEIQGEFDSNPLSIIQDISAAFDAVVVEGVKEMNVAAELESFLQKIVWSLDNRGFKDIKPRGFSP